MEEEIVAPNGTTSRKISGRAFRILDAIANYLNFTIGERLPAFSLIDVSKPIICVFVYVLPPHRHIQIRAQVHNEEVRRVLHTPAAGIQVVNKTTKGIAGKYTIMPKVISLYCYITTERIIIVFPCPSFCCLWLLCVTYLCFPLYIKPWVHTPITPYMCEL